MTPVQPTAWTLKRDVLRAACFAAAGQLDSGASIASVAAYLNQKIDEATR